MPSASSATLRRGFLGAGAARPLARGAGATSAELGISELVVSGLDKLPGRRRHSSQRHLLRLVLRPAGRDVPLADAELGRGARRLHLEPRHVPLGDGEQLRAAGHRREGAPRSRRPCEASEPELRRWPLRLDRRRAVPSGLRQSERARTTPPC